MHVPEINITIIIINITIIIIIIIINITIIINIIIRPHGKESTKVRISQNKGKESENSYQKLKRSLKDRHMETVSRYLDSFHFPFPYFEILLSL